MKCVMRLLKLCLCILILFCGAVTGLHLSGRLTRRRDILLSFDALFHRASIQIEYNAGDLCEVFRGNFADYPFVHDKPFDLQWKTFIDGYSNFLKKEDIATLKAFADNIGTADSVSQRQHISLYCRYLQEHIDSAQEDIRTKAKMYRIIPLSVGMVIALMVI